LDLSTISPHHPDLSNEVATLSDKLIQAINNQSRLDDNLSEARHELEDARARIHQLEGDIRKREDDLSSGRLVWKADVEADLSQMRESLEAERTKRAQAEKEKKGMEQELENLTTALFEEANKVFIFCRPCRPSFQTANIMIVDGRSGKEGYRGRGAQKRTTKGADKGHGDAPCVPSRTTRRTQVNNAADEQRPR
jgi:hypothetical protein